MHQQKHTNTLLTMKNFTFAMKWHEILKPYSDDIRREVYDAIIEYVATGTVIDMQPLARMAFDFIRYEIDEKARRKEACLAKKQQKEAKDNNVTTDETPVEEIPSAPVDPRYDPDKFTDKYLASGKTQDPFIIAKDYQKIKIDSKQMRKFVKRCAQEILRTTYSQYESDILSEINEYVYRCYDKIQRDIWEQCQSTEFTEDLWDKFVNNVCSTVSVEDV